MEASRKKMLVAVDGSERSLEAVHYISGMLDPAGTEVVLFNVFHKVSESYYDLKSIPHYHPTASVVRQWEITNEKRTREFMDRARRILLDAGFPEEAVATRIHIRGKGVARDIAAECEKGYSGVVAGRLGRSKLKELVLGNVAFKLLEGVRNCPVWIVGERPLTGAVLVAMDPSEGAMQAVEYAGFMFGGREIRVELLHVAQVVDAYREAYEEIFGEHPHEKLLEEAGRVMDPVFEEAGERLVRAGVSPERIVSRIVVGESSRAGAIVKEAKKGGIGTVVVGRRGLSKTRSFLMGRVSNKVVQMGRDLAVVVVS